jgi:hypothetical protein
MAIFFGDFGDFLAIFLVMGIIFTAKKELSSGPTKDISEAFTSMTPWYIQTHKHLLSKN